MLHRHESLFLALSLGCRYLQCLCSCRLHLEFSSRVKILHTLSSPGEMAPLPQTLPTLSAQYLEASGGTPAFLPQFPVTHLCVSAPQ